MKVPKVDKGKVLVVKVGSDEYPASPRDLQEVQVQLAQIAADPNLTLVTHHCIEFEVLEELPENVVVLGHKEEESK